jgi:murein DD-endopeptidase MepM/ murein hydrolase activator NlpD
VRWIYLLLLLIAFPVRADYQTVVVPHPALKPGQTFKIVYPSPQRKPPTLIFNDEEIPFYKGTDKKWRALRRVPLDAKAGMKTVFVDIRHYFGIKTAQISVQFEVVPSDYGSETIEFPEDKAKLLNDPSEDEESRRIREVLKEVDDDPHQYWEGNFMAPLPGKELSPYGVTRNKIGQKKKYDFHRGQDLAGALGEVIRAPNGGVVVMAEDFKFHGKTLLLNHGQGVGSVYIHMDKFNVTLGDHVKKGDPLGQVGSSGLATGPHLHWGMYVHGKAVDPVQWYREAF